MIVELLVIVNFILLLIIGVFVAKTYRSVNSSAHRRLDGNVLKQDDTSTNSELRKNSDDVQSRLNKQADDALKAISTLQKFVPKQFIKHFSQHGLDSIELGHATDADVTVMFCDIRDFTGLAENMQPKELMFLNSYFYRMNEPIHQNSGFIDKFIGDAILGIFDRDSGSENSSVDAVRAAIEIYKALDLYNSQRHKSSYKPIKIAIGLHYGNAVLGTVGSEDRMDIQ